MTTHPDLGFDARDLIDSRWHGKRIAIAMSGGVDSSVTAVLCSLAGCEVVGITMKLWDYEAVGGDTARDGRCCTVEAFDKCRAVASQYEFAHYTVDFREQFEKCVIGEFVSEYRRGRTPNPCIACNVDIKWGAFWDKARSFGCEAMATGHYARLEHAADGSVSLRRGVDDSRDQTYFLWGVPSHLLAQTLFPLGGLTKDRVRQVARQLGLRNAETPESRDICFVDDQDLGRFLTERSQRDGVASSSGPIVNQAGDEIGRHNGVESYTIGQRKGLGVAVGRPQYVTAINPDANSVTLGDDADLYSRRLRAASLNWLAPRPAIGDRVFAQIRYRHRAASATITHIESDAIELEFDDPQRAITPGQSAVLYDGDRLLGGGIIDTAQ
jgi:tRNA-specific 2-thiouridylase